MKSNILRLLSFCVLIVFFNNNLEAKLPGDFEVWKVDAEKGSCEGVTSMKCLLVKKQGERDFNLFYDTIEGFEYQEGFTYTLKVRKTFKTPPISVGESPYKYVLEKIMSIKAVNNLSAKSINTKKPYNSSDVSTIKTIIVNEEKVPCEGNPDAKCLLIKFEKNKTFELFYQNIEGFTFEEGYRQTIQVRERPVANPMIKEASPIYTFIKVIEKTKIFDPVFVDTFAVNPNSTPLDKKWYLRKIKDSDTSSFVIEDNEVWMELNTSENKLSGKAPCNTYFARFETDLISTFKAEAVISTKMYCSNISFENLFFSLLQNADNYKIKDGRLTLSIVKRVLLEFE